MSDNYDKSGNKLPPGHVNNDGNTYDQNGQQTNRKPNYDWMNPPQQQTWPNSNSGGAGGSTAGSGCAVLLLIGLGFLVQYFI